MAIKNVQLEKELLSMILALEKKIDYIAETPLRHELSAKLVDMRMALINYTTEVSYD